MDDISQIDPVLRLAQPRGKRPVRQGKLVSAVSPTPPTALTQPQMLKALWQKCTETWAVCEYRPAFLRGVALACSSPFVGAFESCSASQEKTGAPSGPDLRTR